MNGWGFAKLVRLVVLISCALDSIDSTQSMNMLSAGRAVRRVCAIAAQHQRAISTHGPGAQYRTEFERALAAAGAVARSQTSAATAVPLDEVRARTRGHTVVTHPELALRAERDLQAKTDAFKERMAASQRPDPAEVLDGEKMSAAAAHMRGIPLRRKSDYKALIAQYNSRRS